ncbi:flap endonuclease GEN [Neodiprion virginianus]|uniref:flap endonuclease GEN n=1 Tax=Neodiprion virginianus TaxID=2961670 RepID=UPI001EE77150|nr:flap endonuclease GEN [Neodiprion virginianus]
MGVKHLWTILTPFCERKPLFELQGKTLAIDLSCWIVDSQTVTDNVVQPKMYLRNLYFRTINLLLQDIHPVFVLEGKAPDLKQKTIERRNEIQQIKRTGAVALKKATAKRGRTRFNNVLKECEEMLSYMGIKCVQGYGEAEAMCAYLNADGIVDGCVSQDNDCFLYGARVVYRNFNLSGAVASGGSIDVYDMEKIESALNLDRNKMVALALLCGCDYDDGLNGAGKEAALKLFAHVRDEDILDRLKSWKTDNQFETIEARLANPKHCTSCGHNGNVRLHARVGCIGCGTVKSCRNDYKEEKKLIMNEITLRKKAILIDTFPNQEIIDEYLIRKGPVPSSLDLKWQQPKVVKFIFFMEKKLGWEPNYSFEKFLPLMTRWQLVSLPEISLRHSISFMKYSIGLPVSNLIFPDRVKKIRNIKSVASYEIIWNDAEGFLDGLITLSDVKSSEEDAEPLKDDSKEQNPPEGLFVTIEPQSLVVKCYPEIVEKFEEEKVAKKKSKNSKTRAKTTSRGKLKAELNADTEKPEKQVGKRGRKKLADIVNTRKIDDYIVNNVVESLEDSFNKMEITPKRLKSAPQIQRTKDAEVNPRMNNTLDRMFENLTADDFASEGETELDMSDIVEEICNRKIIDLYSSRNNHTLKPENNKENTTPDVSHNNYSDICTAKGNFNLEKAQCYVFEEHINVCPITEHDVTDEFADIENYVPLSQRVNEVKGTQ